MRINKIISLLTVVAAIMTFAATAWAIGTVAGTVISNTATVNYQNAAGVAQAPVVSNTVTTTVQQVAAVVITNTAVTTINVVPGQASVANQFTITNNGNNADKFWITPLTNASITAPIKYYVNSVATATSTVMDAAPILLTASGTDWITPFINSTPASTGAGLYPNGTTIFVVVDIPTTATAGTIAKVQGIGTVKSVFNTAVSNATSVTMNDVVQVGALTVTKQVRNVTTAGAFASTAVGVPGNILEYQITVTNTGTGIANSVVLTDPIDPNTTFVAASDLFGGAAVGTSQVAVTATPTNRVYNLGTAATNAAGGSIPAAGVVTVTFRVTIN